MVSVLVGVRVWLRMGMYERMVSMLLKGRRAKRGMARVRRSNRSSFPFPFLSFSLPIPLKVAPVPVRHNPVPFTFAIAIAVGRNPQPDSSLAFTVPFALCGATTDIPIRRMRSLSFSLLFHPVSLSLHIHTHRSLPLPLHLFPFPLSNCLRAQPIHPWRLGPHLSRPILPSSTGRRSNPAKPNRTHPHRAHTQGSAHRHTHRYPNTKPHTMPGTRVIWSWRHSTCTGRTKLCW